ncbi:MAG: peptidoglycan DD-metalloendopeptidase family protein, partial [Caldilineaceae bacterium]
MSALWNQRNQLVLLTLALFLTAIFIGASQNTANAQTLPFLISPYFGTETVTNPWSAAHQGIDFGMSYERVLSAADGSISQVAWYNNNSWCHQNPSDNTCGYGLYVYVQHSNGYVTRYAHLSTAAFGLGTFGTSVLSGQILGTSGNTGWSTGPHLHFEVRDSNGVSVNPASLWKDGQWATPSRPIPGPPDSSETVVDDIFVNTSSFSKGSGGESLNPCNGNCGGWTWANTGYGNGRFYTLADGGGTIDQGAKWQPTTLPTYNGIYEVFVYVPDNNATSWQAPYKIVHADGTSTAVVDQYGLFNQWVSIGTYRMNANSYVSTYDATGENSN